MRPPVEMGVADAPPARPGVIAVLRAEWHRWRARSGLERAIAIVDRVRHHQFCADRLDPPATPSAPFVADATFHPIAAGQADPPLHRTGRPGASDG